MPNVLTLCKAQGLKEILGKAIKEKVFPGAIVMYGNEKSKISVSMGYLSYDCETRARTEVYYDIASITKICTVTAILMLVSERKLCLDDKIRNILDGGDFFSNITVRQLAGHTSGLRLSLSSLRDKNKIQITREILLASPLTEPGKVTYYSDQGYCVLGMIIEKIEGKKLDEVFREKIFSPLNITATFNPIRDFYPVKIAPTENCKWRNLLLKGEIHDEAAWRMEISGHAGLFCTAIDLFKLGVFWLSEGRPFIHPEIFSESIKFPLVANATKHNDIYGLGWRLSDKRFNGKFISNKTISMEGFTGPSLMVDLEKGLVVVIMNNHIHPRRKNLEELEKRALVHQKITEEIYKII